MEQKERFIGLLKRLLILIAIFFLVIIAVYASAGIDGWGNFLKAFSPELGGSLISFLFGFFIWDWIVKKEQGKENAVLYEKIDQLTTQINIIAQKTNYIEQKANVNSALFGIIRKQDNRIKELILHYSKANPFIGRYYSRIMASYHDTFSIVNNGFHIKDEYLSLSSYVMLWNYMVFAQKERNEVNEKPLIVRIIHSNSIHIWTNEHSKYKEYTNRLLKLQKEFVESGGKIVRIFIGPTKEPGADYLIALNKMEENKIEGKYIQQSEYHRLSYDFLLLHDENLVLKWYSDASGISLAGTLIQDFVEPEVREKWDDLFEELKKMDNPITSIPPDREFKIRKQTI